MTSSPTDAEATAREPLLTAVADWSCVLSVPHDPIQAWIDLMDVVEPSCPE